MIAAGEPNAAPLERGCPHPREVRRNDLNSRMKASALLGLRHLRVRQFIKFCLVGGSGVVIDMTVLYFLADPKWGGWNVTLSKLCAAETAMLNNFLWNELWTFRSSSGGLGLEPGTARRLLRFHAICGIGIGLAVFFLHLFYRGLGLNLYVANFLAILLVTVWNFWLNAVYNWRTKSKASG